MTRPHVGSDVERRRRASVRGRVASPVGGARHRYVTHSRRVVMMMMMMDGDTAQREDQTTARQQQVMMDGRRRWQRRRRAGASPVAALLARSSPVGVFRRAVGCASQTDDG